MQGRGRGHSRRRLDGAGLERRRWLCRRRSGNSAPRDRGPGSPRTSPGASLMASEVKLPRLGQGMESGTVTKWLKNEGDPVEKGEPLYEIDTDKVTQEVESDFAGVLLKIALREGEAPVGQTIAFIGEAGEEVAASEAEPAPQPEQVSDTKVSDTPADVSPAPSTSNG